MSADLLRRAAALMRERATNAAIPDSPWYVEDGDMAFNVLSFDGYDVARDVPDDGNCSPLGDHIASWHPAVALAVADWLDSHALFIDAIAPTAREYERSVAVARAYLGEATP